MSDGIRDDWLSFVQRNFRLGKRSPKGFYPLKCPVCGDKKVRAGFKFDDPMGSIGYNCFRGRCGHRFRWTDGPANEAMQKLFGAAGIAPQDWAHLVTIFRNDNGLSKTEDKPIIRIKEPEEVKLPRGSKLLTDSDLKDPRTKWAIEFLLGKGIDPLGLPYYLCNGPPPKDELDFRNRIIIPFYYNGKIIFYQGRWYNPNVKEPKAKYLNCRGAEREQLFYNMAELDRETETPLLVVEGVFDAEQIGAVSALSNILTDEQIFRLKRCHRKIIIVPDYDKAGYETVKQAVENEFEVSFPDWGSLNDTGDAIQKYGKYRVAGMVADGLCSSGEDALIKAGIYCTNGHY